MGGGRDGGPGPKQVDELAGGALVAGSLETGSVPSLGLPSILRLFFLSKSAPQTSLSLAPAPPFSLSFKLHASPIS